MAGAVKSERREMKSFASSNCDAFPSRIVFPHLRVQYPNGLWSEALVESDRDFVATAAALREMNVHGDAMIELAHERVLTSTRPLRENLRISRAFVRETFGY